MPSARPRLGSEVRSTPLENPVSLPPLVEPAEALSEAMEDFLPEPVGIGVFEIEDGSGRYEVGGMPVLVSRGTGTWGPRMRFWHRGEILRLFPAAKLVKLPGAHHWLHAEKPREFEAAVDTFLDRTGG